MANFGQKYSIQIILMKTTRTKQEKHEIKETIENSKKTNQQGLKKVQLFMAYILLTSLVISISHPVLPKSITFLTSCYLISMISHGYSQFLHLLQVLKTRPSRNRLEGDRAESDTGYGTITNSVLNRPNSDDSAEIPS